MLSHVKMQVEGVRESAVAQAKLHAEAEKKEVRRSEIMDKVVQLLYLDPQPLANKS